MDDQAAPRPISNRVIRWLVYSHAWMGSGAAAMIWWTYLFMSDRDHMMRLILFAFTSTISAYGFMRLMRASDHLTDRFPLFNWVDRYRILLCIMVVITGTVGLIAIIPLIPRLLFLLLGVIPVCILYVMPSDRTSKPSGLRAIPFLKVPIVGIVWALVTVAMPLRAQGYSLVDPAAILLFVHRTLFIMALTIAFDIRDAAIDPSHLRTLPQLLGRRRAKAVAIGMIIVAAIILLAVETIGTHMRISFLLLPLAGHIIAAWLISVADRSRPEAFFGFTLDGMLILVPVLAWLGTLL